MKDTYPISPNVLFLPTCTPDCHCAPDGHYGRLLQTARIDAKLTQVESGKRSGVSSTCVSQIERGVRREPLASTLLRILYHCGVRGLMLGCSCDELNELHNSTVSKRIASGSWRR